MSLSKEAQGNVKTVKKGLSFSRKQLCIPYGLFLALFVVLPLILIAFYAFTDQNGTISVANFIRFFSSATTLSTLLISILLALATTVICIIIIKICNKYLKAWNYQKKITLYKCKTNHKRAKYDNN